MLFEPRELSGHDERSSGAAAASLSIVICAYTFDRFSEVIAAVASARRQDLTPLEIIVVVDHNPALLEALRDALGDDVAVICNGFDRGLSGARNTERNAGGVPR